MSDSRQTDDHGFRSDAKCLGLFAKYWDAGTVKTRLGTDLGMAAAAELHRTFVMHLTSDLSSVTAARRLFIAPDSRCNDVAACTPDGWQVQPQGGGGLGERMQYFFNRCFSHFQRVVLIGSDCPTLTSDRIESAFASLAHHDVVLGPAADGGYYLIGLRNHCQDWMERLFTEMPWSGNRVAEITRQRIRDAGATWTELPCEEDIDTIDCLRRLDDRWSNAPSTRPQDMTLAKAVRFALSGAQPPARAAADQGTETTLQQPPSPF